MRNILLFGAGKSATVLIRYLLENAANESWHLTLVDADIALAKSKIGSHHSGTAVSFDINNDVERKAVISSASIVISLLPPALHLLIARDCILYKKNLLTASYVDDELRELENQIKDNNLLFLCEAGLDPGIDHMSAKKILDEIKTDGGEVTSFISHCGGLVADESDDNPWHYKISWNPRNVVMAGKSGALYLDNNETKQLEYEQLFSEKRYVSIPDYKELSWYPNRNSLTYIRTYKLDHCHTFIRTTLRHLDFVYGWKNIILLKLTDEEKRYQTDGKSLMLFFKEHLEHHHLQGWLQEQMYHKLSSTKNLLEDLVTLVTMEGEVKDKVEKGANDFMIINKKGDLKNIDVATIKTEASVTVANQIHEATTTIKQLLYLGLMDDKTKVNKGLCSAADVLQFALEKKLSLRETDMDLVVMMHDIDYIKEGRKYKMKSTLLVKGENNEETAMAKTVGLPLGLAATLILNGVIKSKGLQIPIHKEIYEPILNELEKHGIHFKEEEIEIE